jgi:IS1 family transposase
MNSWLFPPQTREVQFDEKWNYVGKKEKNCDPDDPRDDDKGDDWDHTAVDPEHRLLLVVVPGERSAENCKKAVREVHERTKGKGAMLLTSDAYPAYATAIEEVYGEWVQPERKPGPGRPPRPRLELPCGLVYATVQKRREKGRVVEVIKAVVFGMACLLDCWLRRSSVSNTINTSFVERNNATDRRQNGRKQRKTYCFSKSKRMHDAATYFVSYSYNFCWPVRTLRVEGEEGWQARTPAMAAGLADHVWSLQEWLTYPAKPRSPV